ncbi:MAG: gliding motility-associated protein GldM [Cyclobacteriaceae bacterium]|jgi:gliding motility-associated protein GldM
MVGMMYLVLTALLALNVSNTVIDKFVFLNESLVRANDESKDRNGQILESIIKTVDDTGKRENDLKVAEAARELRAETERVFAELNSLKDSMVSITGGYIEYEPEYPGDAKNLEGKTDYSKVGHYMMPEGEGGEGKGDELKGLLNGYAEFVSAKLISFGAEDSDVESFRPIAVDAEEDPVYSKDPNQAGKKFAQLAFEESPTPACLATMSEYQSRMLMYETIALDFLSKKVGAGDLSFDRIEAKVLPESKYVAAGTPFKGEMFIAASASGISPTMYYNDNEIPVDDGIGTVQFIAKATTYDENNQSRQSFAAAIKVPLPGGGDTTYTNTIEYFVTKPVIQVQSASVSALYLGCGNKLNILVPALGTAYNPSYNVKGGAAIKGSSVGEVTIVPNAAKVEIGISSSGNYIGSREFSVKPIPQVEIEIGTDAGIVDISKGIPAKSPRLFLRVKPEEGFAEFLPDDAKFIVANAEIKLVSGGLVRQTVSGGGNGINLSRIASSARKGDQLAIEIKRVQRQNFKGQVEDFNRFQKYYNIPLQ